MESKTLTEEELKAELLSGRDEKMNRKLKKIEFPLEKVVIYKVVKSEPGKFGGKSVLVKTGTETGYLPSSLTRDFERENTDIVVDGTYATMLAGEKDVGKAQPMKIWLTKRLT